MQVHFTYDVEIRVDGSTDSSSRLFTPFRRLPYGPPPRQREVQHGVRDNGQWATHRVEPQCSCGNELDVMHALVGLIRFRGHPLVDRFFGWAGLRPESDGGTANVRRLICGHG